MITSLSLTDFTPSTGYPKMPLMCDDDDGTNDELTLSLLLDHQPQVGQYSFIMLWKNYELVWFFQIWLHWACIPCVHICQHFKFVPIVNFHLDTFFLFKAIQLKTNIGDEFEMVLELYVWFCVNFHFTPCPCAEYSQ